VSVAEQGQQGSGESADASAGECRHSQAFCSLYKAVRPRLKLKAGMARIITTPDGRKLDLDYFVEWAAVAVARPVQEAIGHLATLGASACWKSAGCGAKMSALFAMLGAEVTMLDRHQIPAGGARKSQVECRRPCAAGRDQQAALMRILRAAVRSDLHKERSVVH